MKQRARTAAEARHRHQRRRQRHRPEPSDPHNYTHRREFLKRLDDHLATLVAELRDKGLGARAIRGKLRSELREVGRQVLGEHKTGQPGPNAALTK
ncbi:hypothetical protein [Streptomyces sp. SS162]|uniref:hypothetical protein n=1 Tax=Streptomyces sp. SS162 TaxID=3108484 RepID=UPI002F419F14